MRNLDIVSALLLFMGAINWGFIGIFDINIIHLFFENEAGDRFLYALIGFAGLYRAVYFKSIRKRVKEDKN